MIDQLTADAFASYMSRKFGCTILRKSDRVEARMVAGLFGVAHEIVPSMLSSDEFMRAATTIGTLVYMPDHLTPEQQIEVLTHECQHVHQFTHDGASTGISGGAGMWWLYLSQPEARLRYEVEACASGIEVAHELHNGVIPSLDSLAMPLETGYLLDPALVDHAKKLLESRVTTLVATGRPSTQAGIAAVEWLRRMGLAT